MTAKPRTQIFFYYILASPWKLNIKLKDKFLKIPSSYSRTTVKKTKQNLELKGNQLLSMNLRKGYKLSLAIRCISKVLTPDIWGSEKPWTFAKPQTSNIPDLVNSKEICSNSRKFCQEKMKSLLVLLEGLGYVAILPGFHIMIFNQIRMTQSTGRKWSILFISVKFRLCHYLGPTKHCWGTLGYLLRHLENKACNLVPPLLPRSCT